MSGRRDGWLVSTILLVAANVLIPLALLTFARGFFPYKPLLPGLAQYETVTDYGPPPAAPFDRLVFMVIDALRSDFVFSAQSGFEYTQSLIRDGAAVPFTAHATSPTVTLPRLKAMTTGSIPSFLDVVLNLDETDETSTLASQDTWLAQMKAKGTGKLVMYGDDTWLKLFPGMFDRADGTTSFFVSDFTEVDNNVTRHVADELQRDDWNTMVLHYLGLDHIGHKGGPRSPNMLPKQREMDAIIKQIYEAIESKPHLHSTVFVICGDHGMNDAGNHGASSAGETSAALVFVSPKLKTMQRGRQAPLPEDESFLYYSVVEQSDLSPTLGALLGFPVPKNNLGAMIADFLPFWSNHKDQVQILMRNAHQMLDIVTAAFGPQLFVSQTEPKPCSEVAGDVEVLACEWHDASRAARAILESGEGHIEWIVAMTKWLRKAQGIMSSMASNYDDGRLVLGQCLGFLAVVCAVAAAYLTMEGPMASMIPFGAMVLAYAVMMFASSYVEEEHHFWYWATTTWLAIISVRASYQSSKSDLGTAGHLAATVLTLATTRLIRAWNQTGQKHAGEPDVVKTFLLTKPLLLWLLVSAAYLWVHRKLVHGFENALPKAVNVVGSTALALTAFTFKLAFTREHAPELVVGLVDSLMIDPAPGASLVSRARFVFVGLGLATTCLLCSMLAGTRASRKASTVTTLHHIYTLLAMTQSRATNIPLFLLFNVQYYFLAAQDLNHVDLSTVSLLLQHFSFFASGGTNAISSVDLSSAYNGIAGFDVLAVGALTFVGNWAAPIFWTSATTTLLLREHHKGRRGVYRAHVAVLTVFATVSVAAVMAACTVLRAHLFVWTVFSPKYLYCMAWGLGQHLVVNVGLGGVLFWLGTF